MKIIMILVFLFGIISIFSGSNKMNFYYGKKKYIILDKCFKTLDSFIRLLCLFAFVFPYFIDDLNNVWSLVIFPIISLIANYFLMKFGISEDFLMEYKENKIVVEKKEQF